MISIYKWQFDIADEVVLQMAEGARILSVQVQDGRPTLWATVDVDAPLVRRGIFVVGTGGPLGGVDADDFIGTIQMSPFVWHVFDGGEA